MFQYTSTTFTPPINFLGYFLIQNSFYFLNSSYQKKVRTVESFLPQNQSKLANQTGQNHCVSHFTKETCEPLTLYLRDVCALTLY